MIVLQISDTTAIRVSELAGQLGMTPSKFLSDRVELAFGNGRCGALAQPRRSRSSRRRTAISTHADRPYTETLIP